MSLSLFVVLMIVQAVGFLVAGVIVGQMPILKMLVFDRGHRCYGVTKGARQVLMEVLEANGLQAWKRFTTGPTNQTIMDDGCTVINVVDPAFLGKKRKATAISLPVADPLSSAMRAEDTYRNNGWDAGFKEISDPANGLESGSLVVVVTDAHPEFELVFRRKIMKMPKPKFVPV